MVHWYIAKKSFLRVVKHEFYMAHEVLNSTEIHLIGQLDETPNEKISESKTDKILDRLF